MGALGMSTRAWVVAIIALVAGIGIATAGIVDLSSLPGLSAVGGQGDTIEQDGQELAMVDDWELSSQVRYPQAPSSAEICLFTEEPEGYDNFVDFSMSDAKKGKSAGLDYYCTSSITSKTPDLGYIPSGDYFMAATDSNYHDMFKQVTVPETKELAFAEQDKKITLAESSEFDLTASYDSDNTVSYDAHDASGSVQKTSADLNGGSFDNGTRDASIVRTIELDTGVAYLGENNVSSFNDGDGISDVTATVEVDGQEVYTKDLKDGSSGELSDSTSFGEDVDSAVDTDPVKATDTVEITYDFTFSSVNASDTTDDDGDVGVGENMIDVSVLDIYDSYVGTAGETTVNN